METKEETDAQVEGIQGSAGEESSVQLNVTDELVTIQEGLAVIQVPKKNDVFYNPVQQFNRDLTIAVMKMALQIRIASISRNETNTTISTESPDTAPSAENGGVQKITKDCTSEKTLRETNSTGKMPSFDLPIRYSKNVARFRALDALSATGLRALRYALEIPELDEIVANDISAVAVESIRRHVKMNNVGGKVLPVQEDAGLLMYQNRFPLSKRFQVIDLDPYGSPCQFLNGAIQAVDDGGLLCVTCTDMAGLCGNHGEASFAKYGAMPLHAKFCHEMALRLVLGSLERHAAMYKRYIVPLLSLSADFYIRLFVLVYTSATEVKRSASKQSYVYLCNGCESFHLQPVGKRFESGNRKKYSPGSGPVVDTMCAECNQKFSVGGPIWSEPMHQREFVTRVLEMVKANSGKFKTSPRIIGTLSVMLEELETPLYYIPDRLANILHSSTPSLVQFKSAILNLGYEVSGSHANSSGVKTTAPTSVIWDVLRSWERDNPVKRENLSPNSPAYAILNREPKIEVSFKQHENALSKSQKLGLVRYPKNPEVNWGPKARAKGTSNFSSLAEKRHRLQCKRAKRQATQDLKQYPCKRYKEGICSLGDTCRYSHDLDTVASSEGKHQVERVAEEQPDAVLQEETES